MADSSRKGMNSPGDPMRSWWQKLNRNLRHRMILPILRERRPPEYTARSVSIGMAIGMTPTVGVQVALVLLTWMLIHKLYRRWDFSPLIACAWTLISNLVTLPFLYYLFVVTGRIMLGRFENLRGFDSFRVRLGHSVPQDASWFDSLWVYTIALFENFGVPLFIGSLPWALICGWLGYKWSLNIVCKYRVRHPKKLTDA
jgi:uncharacterized protein (DUF2062 family)